MANNSPFNRNYHQGYYKLINEDKYLGNPSNIKYRSSWELGFCQYLDNNPKIKKWGSEIVSIPYLDTSSNGPNNKVRRYYSDFYYEELTNDDNRMKKVVVEIKPKSEVVPPRRPLNETNKSLTNYGYALQMYMKNRLKWDAAVQYCEKRGMEFVIITEDHLKRAGILKS